MNGGDSSHIRLTLSAIPLVSVTPDTRSPADLWWIDEQDLPPEELIGVLQGDSSTSVLSTYSVLFLLFIL